MSQRRDRFAAPRVPRQIKVTEEVIAILVLLERYRYLRSSWIRAFTGRSARGLNNTLRLMFDAHLVEKPAVHRPGFSDRFGEDIYAIRPRGLRILQDLDIQPLPVTRFVKRKPNERGEASKNFVHAVMICDVMASIELGLTDTGYTLVSWPEIIAGCESSSAMSLSCRIRHSFPNGRTEQVETELVPDGLFGILRPDGLIWYFFLEAEHRNPVERTTLSQTSWLKKLLAYNDLAYSGVCQRQLGIPKFRVLVCSPNSTKAGNLVALTETVTGGTNRFLFTDVPVQAGALRPKEPFPDLAKRPWLRAGRDAVSLV